MSTSSLSRSILKRLASAVADRVRSNELFEREGERARQAPIFAAEAAAPAPGVEADGAAPDETDAPAPAADGDAPRRATATLVDLDAVRQALGEGAGVRIVNHWATWCIPCIEEFGHLRALHEAVDGQAELFGVSWDLFDPRGDEDDIREHVENFGTGHGLTWPSLVLAESVAAPDFFDAFDLSFQQIPQTWILDASGAVLHRVDGVIDADDVGRLVALVRDAAGGTA